MWDVLGKLCTRLPIRFELPRTGENFRGRLDKDEVEVFGHRRRQLLSMLPLQFRLRVVKVKLARPAFHKKKDNVLRLPREVRLFGREWIGLWHSNSRSTLDRKQLCERHHTHSTCAITQEAAPRLPLLNVLNSHSQLLPGNEFIKIEQYAAQGCPGGSLNIARTV